MLEKKKYFSRNVEGRDRRMMEVLQWMGVVKLVSRFGKNGYAMYKYLETRYVTISLGIQLGNNLNRLSN